MKKGVLGLKTIVTIIVLITLLWVIASIFLDKNFYDDAIDSINRIWEPPDVDGDLGQQELRIIRQKAINYAAEWIDLFHAVEASEESYCYAKIPALDREIREESFSLEFKSTQEGSFDIELTQEGLMSTIPETINKDLCMIIEPRGRNRGDIDMLTNFLDAFYEDDRDNIQNCLNDPSQCSLVFSKPEQAFEKVDVSPHSFNAIFKINSEEVRDSRNSIEIIYDITKTQGDNPTILANEELRISDTDFILFKMEDSICIMPLSRSQDNCRNWGIFGGDSNREGGFNYLRRGCFFDRSFEPNEKLLTIPECGASEEDMWPLMEDDILITFAILRGQYGTNTYHPKIIRYEDEWIVESAIGQTNINLPSSSQPSPKINDYLSELLKDKDLLEGRAKLCEKYNAAEEVTIEGETEGGNPYEQDYSITKKEGLHCSIVRRLQEQ